MSTEEMLKSLEQELSEFGAELDLEGNIEHNGNQLVYIPIEKLYPHPDNPRKDLGDLTELADSIKAKGIMQNLTVVPRDAGGYTVIIGHRRSAAARKAGLSELPCVISDMSPKEQLATMVMENMQRSDLTFYEEACGMQMMMDLGDTIESVASQTGLSTSTVKRRTNLLKLPEDKLKASMKRGATLMDYEKLDKIKDEELRNEVLDSIGTNNFDWVYKNALEREKGRGNIEKNQKILDSFAEEVEDAKGLKCVCWNVNLARDNFIDVPKDADSVKYYYSKRDNFIVLYREKNEQDLSEENEKDENWIKQNQINAASNGIAKRAFELRKDFIKHAYISSKEQTEELLKFAFSSIYQNQTSYRVVTGNEFCDFAGLGSDETGNTIDDIMRGKLGMKPQRALLIMAYTNYHDSENLSYMGYNNKHTVNAKLEAIYTFLEKLGYECSDEERAWRDGTHEIYVEGED